MPKKKPGKIKVIRKGELVDPRSTEIRSDQAKRLKQVPRPEIKRVQPNDQIKLVSRKIDPVYTAGKLIECASCKQISPTKSMYRYKASSRGTIILCEKCHDAAEVRSFYKLDALDSVRRKIKIR